MEPGCLSSQYTQPDSEAMDSTSSFLTRYITKAISLLQEYKLPLLSLLSLPLLRALYLDYCGWYDLGPGGIPHNILGWVVQSVLSIPASRDLRSTACYQAQKISNLERQNFLEESLPHRKGLIVKTASWCIPHRQLEETANEGLKQVRFCLKAIKIDTNPVP